MTEEVGVYNTDNQLPMQYSLESPHTLIHLAEDLSKFIREQNLSVKIQGKDFVTVEGWQFAGVSLGLVPVIESITNLSTENEIKYQCIVNLIQVRTGDVVGKGYAVCSNKEPSKKSFQEYAILSMSQTRAISRAYRNVLAWLMKASGFEPTPAEEMEFEKAESEKPQFEPPKPLLLQQPEGTVSNKRLSEFLEQWAMVGPEIYSTLIHKEFGNELLHESKMKSLTRFYEVTHHKDFVSHLKTFGNLVTVGDALLLLSKVPDSKAHPIHVRYWTEDELSLLEEKEADDATDEVESE